MCWSRVRAGGSPGLLRILRFEKTRNCLLEFSISEFRLCQSLARGRGTRAALRRLVLHDYGLRQPLIRAGCKRPAPQT